MGEGVQETEKVKRIEGRREYMFNKKDKGREREDVGENER